MYVCMTLQGTVFETVAGYVDVLQRINFVAVAAGVVVHQHTQLLMADLRERADRMQAEKIRGGLSAELDAAHKARIGDPRVTAGGHGIFDRGEHEDRSRVVRLCEVCGKW